MFEAAPTPFDLHFRLFRFPVRVSPWFWVVTLILGVQVARSHGPVGWLLSVACVFVSILLHELGHAVMYRRYGAWATQIVLHGFGGYAKSDHRPSTAWKRIVVALAGPAAQLVFFGLLVGSDLALHWSRTNEWVELTFDLLTWINLAWPILNLLPVFPLDGGQVSRELFGLARVRQADRKAFGLSVALAGGLALVSLLITARMLPPEIAARVPAVLRLGQIGILLFALLAIQNYQFWQQARRTYSSWDDEPFGRGGRRW